jgi:hypothetical protein
VVIVRDRDDEQVTHPVGLEWELERAHGRDFFLDFDHDDLARGVGVPNPRCDVTANQPLDYAGVPAAALVASELAERVHVVCSRDARTRPRHERP